MSRAWWGKLLLLAFVVVLSVIYIIPTVANLNPETSKFPFKQKINLGLDLQGGLYMVLGVDFNKVYKDILDRQETSLGSRLKEKGVQVTELKPSAPGAADDPRFEVNFEPSAHDAVYGLLKKEFTSLRVVGDTPNQLSLGLTREYRNEVRDRTINQSIEVIRNRIDEFGVAEPSISSQGNDRVVVELPGVKEIDRAKDLIGRTAKLEFKIVDDTTMAPDQLAKLVGDIEKQSGVTYKPGQSFNDYMTKINELAQGKIPAGKMIAFERPKANGKGEESAIRIPMLVGVKADMTGEDLQDASVSLDHSDSGQNRPVVAFQFNPRGAATSERVTGENIHKRMAIVLDNVVQSAPMIQSKISDRGQITLGSGDYDAMMREAQDLSIVLRAGALPAKLEFLEQRIIGPSLGQDSIHKGALASVIGSILVFLFVAFYYRVSGLIAVFSLVLNVIFVLACLVGLEATLTLPGIAGIALTVGIAVDSNVVIYERIREELRHGKNPHGAVESGFQKAFRTIMDANVTNALAAIVLLMYGTGPIKGFAVTLLIGIITTLFTAVFVCKLVFDAYLYRLDSRGSKELSI
ncbi:MAG: protein translocase subunit SecD [Bdellovibrionia bacterium]